MASNHHYLRKVGEEAFGLIDQLYVQSTSSSCSQQRPYVYGGPQAVTVVQEPNAYIGGAEVHMENKTAAYSCQAPEVFRVTKAAPKSNAWRSVQTAAPKAEEQPGLTCQDAARIFGGIRICEHLNLRAKPHKTWDF